MICKLERIRDKLRHLGRWGTTVLLRVRKRKKEPAFQALFRSFYFLKTPVAVLQTGIFPKASLYSRKTQAGRLASHTGINSTSAVRVLFADIAVDQQPDFFWQFPIPPFVVSYITPELGSYQVEKEKAGISCRARHFLIIYLYGCCHNGRRLVLQRRDCDPPIT